MLRFPWLLLLVNAKAAVAVSSEFLSSGNLAALGLAGDVLDSGRSLLNIARHEVWPLPGSEEAKKQRQMNAINKFRAEICAKMKQEHGVEFGSYESCVDFMKGACKPGKDQKMDGDRKETTSGEGYCSEFFPQAVKKAEEQVAAEDAAAAVSPGPAPSPASAPSPGPAANMSAAAAGVAPAAAAGVGLAPAPGPAGSPAGPAPAPFIPGVSAGKPPGPIPKDEAYYYKKSGKDMKRMHMDESKGLPTQGYFGKLVEHEDKQTATEDWGQEQTEESFDAFCKKNPSNPWCEGHHHSAASCLTIYVALLLLSIINFAL